MIKLVTFMGPGGGTPRSQFQMHSVFPCAVQPSKDFFSQKCEKSGAFFKNSFFAARVLILDPLRYALHFNQSWPGRPKNSSRQPASLSRFSLSITSLETLTFIDLLDHKRKCVYEPSQCVYAKSG